MRFQIDPDVAFFNHGSFGACPTPVHEQYQQFQRQLESQPVRFMQRELPALLAESRERLAKFIHCESDEVVYVVNPTFAANEIARSLDLGPDEEVLMSDHEYGACLNAWQFMSEKNGFSIRQQPIPIPVNENEMTDLFWSGVSERTSVIFLSHITSPTAITFPVAEICRRAKQHGILTIVDGAHVPGQIELNVKEIGADFYIGTCHKWLCSAKGASFLYAERSKQSLIEPLVVGWGWGFENRLFNSGSDFLDHHEWLGTHDPAAYLTVPYAIAFQAENDWPSVRKRCHEMAVEIVNRGSQIEGLARVHADSQFYQMALLEIVGGGDKAEIKRRLYDDHKVEVPLYAWNDRLFVRVSVNAYNTDDDVDRLMTALAEVV